MATLNFLIPILSWIFIFTDKSPSLNECLGKGYLNFFSTKLQYCSNENLFSSIFCWTWLIILIALMSNVIDTFFALYCFKDINKGTEHSRNMLSKKAYINRKRYCIFFILMVSISFYASNTVHENT